MSGADWVGAVAGVGGAAVAGVACWWAWRSAQAAKESAESAAETVRIERGRDHLALAPPQPASIELKMKREGQVYRLYATVSAPRTYRLRADIVHRDGNIVAASDLPLQLHANQPRTFHVEDLTHQEADTTVAMIRFKAWPPGLSDEGVVGWTCRCGRPTEDVQGPSHWSWEVPVEYTPWSLGIY